MPFANVPRRNPALMTYWKSKEVSWLINDVAHVLNDKIAVWIPFGLRNPFVITPNPAIFELNIIIAVSYVLTAYVEHLFFEIRCHNKFS